MVVETLYTIAGVQFDDVESAVVTKAMGTNNSSSFFKFNLPNHAGLHTDDVSIGDEVVIKAEKDVNPATTKILTGIVEDINFRGKGQDEIMEIRGRDFSARLQDSTIPPTVFNDKEISLIVTDLINDNVTGITTNNVNVTTTLLRNIAFNHLNVFDAIKQLADLSGFIFFVDEDKDLNFIERSSISSGFQLDDTNVRSSKFLSSDKDMANEVFVYGDRQLSAQQEVFTADGGSVFTLLNNPHNTEVFIGTGSTPERGGIFELVNFPASGNDYVVDFDLKKIIFISGTSAGDNIPASGTEININYDRSTPIVKFGTDQGSIEQFGKKSKVIIDKNIKTPSMAVDFLKNELSLNSQPKIQGTVELDTIVNLTAGHTISVNLPNSAQVNQVYDLIEVRYELNVRNNEQNKVLRVKVSRKLSDILDTIKQLALDIRKIQAQDILDTDVITRLEQATGSLGVRVKSFQVDTRFLGSDTRWGLFNWGEENWDNTFTNSFVTQVSGGE